MISGLIWVLYLQCLAREVQESCRFRLTRWLAMWLRMGIGCYRQQGPMRQKLFRWFYQRWRPLLIHVETTSFFGGTVCALTYISSPLKGLGISFVRFLLWFPGLIWCSSRRQFPDAPSWLDCPFKQSYLFAIGWRLGEWTCHCRVVCAQMAWRLMNICSFYVSLPNQYGFISLVGCFLLFRIPSTRSPLSFSTNGLCAIRELALS